MNCKNLLCLVVLALLARHSAVRAEDAHGHEVKLGAISAEEAIKKLQDGNKDFVDGNMKHPRQTAAQRAALAKGQTPFAVILGCADSRTAPEIIFDQGLGDLFVERVAGNIVDDHAMGSIEYAVEHLGARLIVVLGHERCGAVTAAKNAAGDKGKAIAKIYSVLESIKPAVEATKGADVDATIKQNVARSEYLLNKDEKDGSETELHKLIVKHKVEVVGAYYDLDTGAVTFLDWPRK